MNAAPWYVLRNQIVNSAESGLKLRDADRALIAHNTMVGWSGVQRHAGLLRAMVSRNNLWKLDIAYMIHYLSGCHLE